MTLRRAPLPLRLLVPRRGVGAGGAGAQGGGARLRGPRPDRPRRGLGGDGVRAGLQVVRGAPDRGCRADSDSDGARPFHLTLLVESREGWRNLCRLITEAHRDTRPTPGPGALPPVLPLDLARGAGRGPRLPLRVRPRRGARRRRSSAPAGARPPAEARGAEALGRRLRERLRARPLPGRAPAAVLAPRPGAQSLAGRPRGAARRSAAWRRATSTCTTPRGRRSRTRWSPCGWGGRWRRRSPSGAGTARPIWPRRRRWPPGSRSIRTRSRRAARLAERLEFDLTRDLGYRYPGLGGSRRRSGAGRDLPGPARAPVRGRAASGGRRAGGWRRSSR